VNHPNGLRVAVLSCGVVRQVGFETCLSAYGGVVRPGSDPFDLKRIAVSPWYISPYQFGFEVMLTGD
jgi:hypothetical protein